MTGVAIVIPMLNEAAGLPRVLRSEGHFEYMRQRAAALKKPPPEPPKPVYAPGSLERQQAEKGE